MATTRKLMTADELLRMPDDHMRHELVRGELRTMPPAGWEHGAVAFEFARILGNHIVANKLGRAFAAETGFKIFQNPDTVRAPDAAFVSNDRIPRGEPPRGYAAIVPDLVVEVLSPGDSRREVQEKTDDWLEAGVRVVWIADPRRRTVTEHRGGRQTRILTSNDELEADDILPGFRCRVGDLFPEAL